MDFMDFIGVNLKNCGRRTHTNPITNAEVRGGGQTKKL
jgi:hypothetical protein